MLREVVNLWGAIIAGMGMMMQGGGELAAANKALRTADINANLINQETVEEGRRLRDDINQSEGLMSAMSAASGVQSTGSRGLAIDKTKANNKAQLDWLVKSGQQKATVVRRGAQLQSSQLKNQATASKVAGFGQIAQGIYSGLSN